MKRRDILKGLTILPLAGGIAGSTVESAFGAPVKPPQQKTGKSTYEPLGVRPIINGGGTVTVIGASRILPEVQKAMDDATREYVHIDELMEGVGRRLAELTGAESGCITPGASAAITAGTAACVTGGDPDKLWRIPDTTGMKDEVIITSYSRTAYDAGARAVGVRMVQVGNLEELKSAIGPRTAMILVLAGAQSRSGPLSLKVISGVAKPMGVPILVDAAAEALEVPNPHIVDGADLVAYSGGKRLRGPQCSGLLIGRKDLIPAARINTGPHHGFGRGYKVGREEIMGLMMAVEMWFKRDMAAEAKAAAVLAGNIVNRLKSVPGLTVSGSAAGAGGQGSTSVRLTWDINKIPLTGADVERLLYDGNPRIVVSLSGSYLPFPPNTQPNVSINTSQLEPGEETIIADRVFSLLSNPPKLEKPQGAPSADLSGQWDLELKFTASTVNHILIIEQKENQLVGTQVGSIGPRGLEGTIYGKEVLIRSSYSLNGARINYTFTGTVIGDTMQGKVSLSEYGKAEWKATRHVYTPILVK
jgi:D-glucosaminate-6-phosphate ammonia-lyase